MRSRALLCALASALTILLASPLSLRAQSSTFHTDYLDQTLSAAGGVLQGHLDDAPDFKLTLTYPSGAPPSRAGISSYPANKPGPPGFTEIKLNMMFELGPGNPGFEFKGASTLRVTLPASIPNGTTLKLSPWSFDENGDVVYGNAINAVSSDGAATFVIQNLTMPRYSGFGMTLGR